MAYSIEAALKSKAFSEVMVSTDSQKYADIAIECGAQVPFLRSAETSGDSASSWDTVKEVLREYEKLGKTFDTICPLQPTSPLRTAEDIAAAYSLYEKKASVSVISVCEMEHTPLWSNTLPEDLSLDGFIKRDQGKRRQEYDTFYRLNGAIYIISVEELLKDTHFYRAGSYAYIMPGERSVDIDTEDDFKYVEFLMAK
jgi:CMP-N,N'-diacetyllegionaminic acid synthase